MKTDDKRERVAELITALLVAMATLGTAWSGYQASLWGGVQVTSYSQEGAKRTESVRAYNRAGQFRLVDALMVSSWTDAYLDGDLEKAQIYAERFRPELKVAFDAWQASDPENEADVTGPFLMDEYQLVTDELFYELELEAEALFEQGRATNAQSDEYVLNTVYLASVLFFAGIASRFLWMPVRYAILALATVMFVVGMYNLIVYPAL